MVWLIFSICVIISVSGVKSEGNSYYVLYCLIIAVKYETTRIDEIEIIINGWLGWSITNWAHILSFYYSQIRFCTRQNIFKVAWSGSAYFFYYNARNARFFLLHFSNETMIGLFTFLEQCLRNAHKRLEHLWITCLNRTTGLSVSTLKASSNF